MQDEKGTATLSPIHTLINHCILIQLNTSGPNNLQRARTQVVLFVSTYTGNFTVNKDRFISDTLIAPKKNFTKGT